MDLYGQYWLSGLIMGVMAFWPLMFLIMIFAYDWAPNQKLKATKNPWPLNECEMCSEIREIIKQNCIYPEGQDRTVQPDQHEQANPSQRSGTA